MSRAVSVPSGPSPEEDVGGSASFVSQSAVLLVSTGVTAALSALYLAGVGRVLGPVDPDYKATFLLRRADKPEAGAQDELDCSGDESLVCCAHDATGQEVIVSGTLTSLSGATPPDKRTYVIAGATICQPSP